MQDWAGFKASQHRQPSKAAATQYMLWCGQHAQHVCT